jgi:hypothetical protein
LYSDEYEYFDDSYEQNQLEKDTYKALTDGQYSSYEDFQESSGDINELKVF